MTIKQFNKKIEEINELIETLNTDHLCDVIQTLEDKKEYIESKAYDRESGENTNAEQTKIDKLDEDIDNLNSLEFETLELFEEAE